MNPLDRQFGENKDNTHRSLQELVSVNAWFVQDKEVPSRFTFHADVSFTEERLGGGAATHVTFKLAVKRCDIIFVLPSTAPFRVDASTVRVPKPLKPKSVIQTNASKSKGSVRGTLSLGRAGIGAAGDASASHEVEQNRVAQTEQTIGLYNELWKKARGGASCLVGGRSRSRQ